MAIDDDIMAKIDGINASKQAIVEAINRKGYPVPKNATLAELSSIVDMIQTSKPTLDTCEIPKGDPFVIPYGVKTVSANEMSRHSGDILVIPNSVTKITNSGAYNYFGFRLIAFGDSVEEIGDYAFWTLSNSKLDVNRLSFPRSLKKIGKQAFHLYAPGSTFSFRDTLLEEYGESAVYPTGPSGRYFSVSIIIPSSIKFIDKRAFFVDDSMLYLDITIDKTREEVKAMSGYPFQLYHSRQVTIHCSDGDL